MRTVVPKVTGSASLQRARERARSTNRSKSAPSTGVKSSTAQRIQQDRLRRARSSTKTRSVLTSTGKASDSTIETRKKNARLSAGAARIQAARDRLRDSREAAAKTPTKMVGGAKLTGIQTKAGDKAGPKSISETKGNGQVDKGTSGRPTIKAREKQRAKTARKDYTDSLGTGPIPGGGLTVGDGSRPNTKFGSSRRPSGENLGSGGGDITPGSGHGRDLWSDRSNNCHYGPYSNFYWNWNAWGCGYGWFWCPAQWVTSCWWDSYWYNGGYWNYGYRPSFYYCGPFTAPNYTVIVQVNESPLVIEESAPAPQVQVAEAVAPAPIAAPAINRAAEYYLTLGDRAFRSGRYSDAVHHYGKAVEYSPGEGILYLILSDALFATGDYHYGAFTLRKAFELDPALVDLTVNKRDFYGLPADLDAQMTRARTFVLQNPDDDDALLMLIANEVFTGNPSGAINLLKQPASSRTAQGNAGILLQERARIDMERAQQPAPSESADAVFEVVPLGQE